MFHGGIYSYITLQQLKHSQSGWLVTSSRRTLYHSLKKPMLAEQASARWVATRITIKVVLKDCIKTKKRSKRVSGPSLSTSLVLVLIRSRPAFGPGLCSSLSLSCLCFFDSYTTVSSPNLFSFAQQVDKTWRYDTVAQLCTNILQC